MLGLTSPSYFSVVFQGTDNVFVRKPDNGSDLCQESHVFSTPAVQRENVSSDSQGSYLLLHLNSLF